MHFIHVIWLWGEKKQDVPFEKEKGKEGKLKGKVGEKKKWMIRIEKKK